MATRTGLFGCQMPTFQLEGLVAGGRGGRESVLCQAQPHLSFTVVTVVRGGVRMMPTLQMRMLELRGGMMSLKTSSKGARGLI